MTDEGVIKTAALVTSITGGFVTLITWMRNKTSKSEMPTQPPTDLFPTLNRILQSQSDILVKMATIESEVGHAQKEMRTVAKQVEHDHREIKLLRETLISWGKLDAEKERRERESHHSDTDTGEMPATA